MRAENSRIRLPSVLAGEDEFELLSREPAEVRVHLLEHPILGTCPIALFSFMVVAVMACRGVPASDAGSAKEESNASEDLAEGDAFKRKGLMPPEGLSGSGHCEIGDLAVGVRLGTTHFRHSGPVRGLVSLLNGAILCSGGRDGWLRAWNAADGKELRWEEVRDEASQGDGPKAVFSISASNSLNGSLVAWRTADAVGVWNVINGAQVATLPQSTSDISLSPDSKCVALAGDDGLIRLWSFQESSQCSTLSGHKGPARLVKYSPDCTTLVSAGEDNTVRIWNVRDRKEVRSIEGEFAKLTCLALSPDGSTIALSSEDSTITLYDLAGKLERRWWAHAGWVMYVGFSPDGRMLASGGSDGSVRLWDMRTGCLLRDFKQTCPVFSLCFCLDGKAIATGARDSTIRLWNIEQGARQFVSSSHEADMVSVELLPDGSRVISADSNGSIALWSSVSAVKTGENAASNKALSALAVSSDGTAFATAGEDGVIRIWDLRLLMEIRSLEGHKEPVWAVAFSRDGSKLASGSRDGSVRIWHVETGQVIKEIWCGEGFHKAVHCLAFSPDGKRIAIAGQDQAIQIWSTQGFTQLSTITGHSSSVSAVAFSPDRKYLASIAGFTDRTIRVWQVDTRREVLRFSCDHEPCSLDLSHDGRFLATGYEDGSVQIYELASGKAVFTSRVHRGRVNSVKYSLDDRYLLTGSSDTTAFLRDLSRCCQLLEDRRRPPSFDLSRLWDRLGAQNASEAFRALSVLASHHDESVCFIAARLRDPLIDESRIPLLISQLDADEVADREQALAELWPLREVLHPHIIQALASNPSTEARERLNMLLEPPVGPVISHKELLRRSRALQVLERIGTHSARELLESMSERGCCSRERSEATESLKRLQQRDLKERR